jgi:phosphoribosylamine--glycine ligase
VLVVGSGAREHALCWKLAGEAGVETVIAAPGNALMSDVADVRAVGLADGAALVDLAAHERVDLVVVGPEAPLIDGIADTMRARGIACFGPGADAARLEGSKSFARDVCRNAGVKVADGHSFTDTSAAIAYAELLGTPVVVKADGLAGGKGVTVAETGAEAALAIRDALDGDRFGEAGRRVVIERWLSGTEASVIALCDGERALLLPAARDHKRLGEGDTGPNTGGMGALSPVDELSAIDLEDIRTAVFVPVLTEMAARGTPFRGALFAGLMLTSDGPRVLEFNVRFGDPETQAIMPLFGAPLAPLLAAAAMGSFDALGNGLAALDDATVALTLAASGYPETPRAGDRIIGIERARRAGALVFGAGVRSDEQGGGLETAGGRVLTVVGRGPDASSAASAAYSAAELIEFDGKVLRRDIGRGAAAVAA